MSVLTSTNFRHGWAIFGPLADKNTRKGELVAPSQRTAFWTFFQHALRYQFETWYIHLVGSVTHQVSSQSGHPDIHVLYSQEWVEVIFLHLWPQKLYRAFRFGTLWPISCSYPRHSQLARHSLMLANGRIRQSLTALVTQVDLILNLRIISFNNSGDQLNHRHSENFWAFTGPRRYFCLIWLTLNMIIHRSFTGPTHL